MREASSGRDSRMGDEWVTQEVKKKEKRKLNGMARCGLHFFYFRSAEADHCGNRWQLCSRLKKKNKEQRSRECRSHRIAKDNTPFMANCWLKSPLPHPQTLFLPPPPLIQPRCAHTCSIAHVSFPFSPILYCYIYHESGIHTRAVHVLPTQGVESQTAKWSPPCCRPCLAAL